MSEWSFLTNHARVLACIVRDPEVRLRDIASMLDITERSVFRMVDDLALAGYVAKEKEGRRNRYQVQVDARLGVLSRLVGGADRGPASECRVTSMMVVGVEESVKGPWFASVRAPHWAAGAVFQARWTLVLEPAPPLRGGLAGNAHFGGHMGDGTP